METWKNVKLLNDTDSESSKFAARKWYAISDQNNTEYGEGNENDSSFKFDTNVIKSNLCDYSYEYILVTGDIAVIGFNADTNVAFKNCVSFTKCVTDVNDEYLDNAENLDIIMPMYNLIEYNDNYSDTSGILWQFKRDESPINDAGNPINVAIDNSSSFKCKSSILGKPAANNNNNRVLKDVKIVVPLKYLSTFWRPLEMSLINCKIHLELNWTKLFNVWY